MHKKSYKHISNLSPIFLRIQIQLIKNDSIFMQIWTHFLIMKYWEMMQMMDIDFEKMF